MNKKSDLISVIMSVYNEKEEYLKQTIESIKSQTYKNIEFIIIIDDPENVKMCQFIEKITKNDKRITVSYNEKNIGLTASLNRAIGLAHGKYVARMDSDDISEVNRLEKQIEYLKKYKLDLVGSEMRHISSTNEIISELTNKSYSPKCLSKCLKYGNLIAHPTWLLKKEVYISLNGYREMPACEDYDFLLRAIHKGYKIGICDQILLNYRINENGISRKNLLKQQVASNYLSTHYNHIEAISVDKVKKNTERLCTEKSKTNYNKAVYYFEYAYQNTKNKFIFITYLIKALFASRFMCRRLYNILRIQIYKNLSS